MAQDETAGEPVAAPAGRWSWLSEDWLAVIAGLTLLTLVLTGILPDGLVP
ncbi:hypothetical protein [Nocardia sp. NPDC005978]